MSLPINTTTLLVLSVIFIGLVFALVSGGIQKEVKKLTSFSEKNSPNIESSTQGSSLSFGKIPKMNKCSQTRVQKCRIVGL